MTNKQDIKALTHDELFEALIDMGLPKFRVDQVEQWLWEKGADSFDEMTNLSKDLRAQLREKFSLTLPEIIEKQTSSDGTRKYLFELADGVTVESVGIPSPDETRLTVCFSTQAGCGMGCVFCATGKGGIKRNLTAGEIYDQVLLVGKDFNMRVTNAVAMGQGEPFNNYDAVMQAVRKMNDEKGLGIGARHITISTCGVINGITRFMQEPEQFTLAVSLHSAFQNTRDELMPGIKADHVDELKWELKSYGELTKRRPTIEYAPIAGINDDDESIDALVEFCKGMLCHVNLIPLNEISEDEESEELLQPSPYIEKIERALAANHVEVSIRNSRGSDIDGACGQLSQRHAR